MTVAERFTIVQHFPPNRGGRNPKISPPTENVSPPKFPPNVACKSMFPPLSEMWRGHPCNVAGKVSQSAFPTKFGGEIPPLSPPNATNLGGFPVFSPANLQTSKFRVLGGTHPDFRCRIYPPNGGDRPPPMFPPHFSK